jgi:hypothetical protein
MQQVGLFDTYEKSQNDLMKRFAAGKLQEDALVTVVANTLIVDKLVPVERMTFFVSGVIESLRIRYDGSKDVGIHRHALGQLCQKATMPMNFTNSLLTPPRAEEKLPRLHLLANNLRELFSMQEFKDRSGAPARFLHRTVNDELRGFLSQRYNRHLASAPLLRAFISACTEAGAKPVEATSSPVRCSLKCLMPMVFEAFPGEHVAIGVEWGNSDFGAGKLSVCQTVWRIKTGTSAVLDETISRVHLGSIITDSDLEISDDTARKEVIAQASAIRDAVTAQLSEKTMERMLLALRVAHEEKIPWAKLRGRLAGVLTKSDLVWLQQEADHGGIMDLPPVSYDPDGARVPNAYWAAAALGIVATKTEDQDRKLELQREAGKLLAGALGSVDA